MTTTFHHHWRDVPESNWRWPNFSPAEIACRGTGKLLVNEPALDRLQALRDRLGKPLIVRSAYRSPEHNLAVGGATRSKHLDGAAFDIAMTNHDPVPFEAAAREPDPSRQLQAYSQAAATLNLLRAFTQGGYASLTRVHQWTLGFLDRSPQGERYRDMAHRITEALEFMQACGVTDLTTPEINRTTLETRSRPAPDVRGDGPRGSRRRDVRRGRRGSGRRR